MFILLLWNSAKKSNNLITYHILNLSALEKRPRTVHHSNIMFRIRCSQNTSMCMIPILINKPECMLNTKPQAVAIHINVNQCQRLKRLNVALFFILYFSKVSLALFSEVLVVWRTSWWQYFSLDEFHHINIPLWVHWVHLFPTETGNLTV